MSDNDQNPPAPRVLYALSARAYGLGVEVRRAHEADAGLDLPMLDYTVILPHETVVLDTGVIVHLPPGHVGFVKPRSSTAVRGLLVHGGVIDSGYHGTIKIIVTPLHDYFTVQRGDYLAQLVIVPLWTGTTQYVEMAAMPASIRGANGFGSTGA